MSHCLLQSIGNIPLNSCVSFPLLARFELGKVLVCDSFMNSETKDSLVNFYAKSHHLIEAHLVFEETEVKDIVSWNGLINGYSQLGTPKSSSSVMKLFKLMRKENTFPDAPTFARFFFCGVDFDGPIFLVCDARKVFDRMPERNSISWATMIPRYAMHRFAGYALEVFRMMTWEEKEDVNEFVVTSVLSAFTLPKFIDIGKQIHCLAVKNGLLSVGNAVVTLYAKCGNLDNSLKMFELSSEKNSITWSAMITGYAQSGNGEKALKMFSDMHFSGMRPSEFTLVGVLNACSDVGATVEGKQLHGYLIKLGFESQIYIITTLVDMYAKCGNVGDITYNPVGGNVFLQERDGG
ncbi:unnamed protein product [Ilex paraguariensis]|uniref:Pentatricopeptide repeat-containing protein n=1 Tax=Ilex paraguariensis TaxID=185542 RepID=A0ABC8SU56_9AQUA